MVLPGANQISSLGPTTTTGALALNDASALAVTGPVSAGGTAAIASAARLTLAGDVTAASVQLTGGATGIVQNAGSIVTPGALTVSTPGAVVQTGGSLAATTLAAPAIGSAGLTAPGNAVVNLGPVGAAGDFALTDARAPSTMPSDTVHIATPNSGAMPGTSVVKPSASRHSPAPDGPSRSTTAPRLTRPDARPSAMRRMRSAAMGRDRSACVVMPAPAAPTASPGRRAAAAAWQTRPAR